MHQCICRTLLLFKGLAAKSVLKQLCAKVNLCFRFFCRCDDGRKQASFDVYFCDTEMKYLNLFINNY